MKGEGSRVFRSSNKTGGDQDREREGEEYLGLANSTRG